MKSGLQCFLCFLRNGRCWSEQQCEILPLAHSTSLRAGEDHSAESTGTTSFIKLHRNEWRVYIICFYVCRAVKNSWPCSPGNSSGMNELKSEFYVSYVYFEEKWRVVVTHELKLSLMWSAFYNAAYISIEVYMKMKQIVESFQKLLFLWNLSGCHQGRGLADLLLLSLG